MKRTALLLILIAGCSPIAAKPNEPTAAKFPRLSSGTTGIIWGAKFVEVPDEVDIDWDSKSPEFVTLQVQEGDKLIVLKDDGPESKSERTVRVKMETGQHKDGIYRIERSMIAPIH